MVEKQYSNLAKPVKTLRESRDRVKTLHGVAIHTCGTGILTRAAKKWRGLSSPLDIAAEIYSEDNFPHYVGDGKGDFLQIATETTRAWHAGLLPSEIRGYSMMSWRRRVGRTALSCWKASFPGMATPLGLFPGNDPNEVYIGIELIPMADRCFTEKQYISLADLILDIWKRHELPPFENWHGTPYIDHWEKMRRTGRLVGHEDLQAYRRWDRNGGWDPGASRRQPRFHWSKLFQLMG